MSTVWSYDDAETFAFEADDSGLGHAIGYAPDDDEEFNAMAVNLIAAYRTLALLAQERCAEHDIEPYSDWTYLD